MPWFRPLASDRWVMCPLLQIYGHEDVKKALLLAMVGGVSKVRRWGRGGEGGRRVVAQEEWSGHSMQP